MSKAVSKRKKPKEPTHTTHTYEVTFEAPISDKMWESPDPSPLEKMLGIDEEYKQCADKLAKANNRAIELNGAMYNVQALVAALQRICFDREAAGLLNLARMECERVKPVSGGWPT